jgi:hypothetical protein
MHDRAFTGQCAPHDADIVQLVDGSTACQGHAATTRWVAEPLYGGCYHHGKVLGFLCHKSCAETFLGIGMNDLSTDRRAFACNITWKDN